MQPTEVSKIICSLLLVQCILAVCAQAAPADTAKLLQQRHVEENSTQSASEQTIVIHDYVKTVLSYRQYWNNRNCDLDFQCAPVSPQHCTYQIANFIYQDAFQEDNEQPHAVCDMDFRVYVEDNIASITGLELSLYVRTDLMDPDNLYFLYIIRKDLKSQVVTSRTLDSNCEGWQTFRHDSSKNKTYPVKLIKGNNNVKLTLALFVYSISSDSLKLLECADIKKMVYLDNKTENFFNYIQNKKTEQSAQTEEKNKREAKRDLHTTEKPTSSITTDVKTSSTTSKPTSTSSTTDTTAESIPTTNTTEITHSTVSTETASSTTAAESPSSNTEGSGAATLEPTATLEPIPVMPVLSEEDSFLPIITVFIDRPVSI